MPKAVVPYDPIRHDTRTLRQQFASMIMVDSYQQSLEERRILAGENPFKVWREHFNETIENVAHSMGVDDILYTHFETGDNDPNVDDILAFCFYFSLHPFDLMDDHAASYAMIEALLSVHERPSLLSPKCRSSDDKASHILIEEAQQAYNDIFRMRDTLERTYPDLYKLVIEFLNELMALDGRLSINPLDLFDQAYNFWKAEDGRMQSSKLKAEKYYQDYRAHHKIFNDFGNRLHRDDWVWVAQKLKTRIKETSLDEALDAYRIDPSFIGRKNFPELTSPILSDGKAYTWDQAHKRHILLTELRYLAYQEHLYHFGIARDIKEPLNWFDEWMQSKSHNLLARFENRQVIVNHPDFRRLVDDVPQRLSLPKPQIAPEWVRMFGLNL